MKWGTSVKMTCCEDDTTKYDLNADGTPASQEDIAAQRVCPPPDAGIDGDGGALSLLRYGDAIPYITNINGDPGYDQELNVQTPQGTTYTRNCFHNRSLQSPIHFAAITDYYERNAHLHKWNESDVNIEYDNTKGEEWNQEKHPESFYQLCVAERAKKTKCCDGTSRAPCQTDSTLACKYPGYHVDPTLAHCGTNADGVVGQGCDCAQCDASPGGPNDPDTWTPQIDSTNHYNEYYFFHGRC